MKYYPVCLDVKQRNCLVVGGGSVGFRKALGLEKCGARVRVVSPEFSPQFNAHQSRGIQLQSRAYQTSDLEGTFLVFAATDNADLNREVMDDAKARGVLCCLADRPECSDFILPAVVEQGDLVLSVSTSGASPALARKIKQDISRMFGPEYAVFLKLMKQIRQRLLAEGHDPSGHRQVFTTLAGSDIPELIRSGNIQQIDSILTGLLGRDYTHESLASRED